LVKASPFCLLAVLLLIWMHGNHLLWEIYPQIKH